MAGKGRKVYELDLHGKKLTRIEGLEKVCWLKRVWLGVLVHAVSTFFFDVWTQFAALRILDLSCNHLCQIEGLDKNRVSGLWLRARTR